MLNGVGTLKITSAYGNGISCKDDIKITGGTCNISTAKDSIEAHDSIRIYSDIEAALKAEKNAIL